MKQLKLFALLSFAFLALPLMAQEEETDVVVVETETEEAAVDQVAQDYGLDREYVDFTADQRKFNSWSFALYGGIPIIQGADLNTFVDGEDAVWSYDVQGVLTKQITHAFGLGLQGNWGRTEQQTAEQAYRGHTEYWMWSLIGDVNLSNLFRRVDNKSRFGWALHLYGGIGTLQYKAYRRDGDSDFREINDIGGSGSVFINGGGGLRYKLSQKLDMEAKVLYYFTGDEEFDGSGSSGAVAEIEEGKDDGLFTVSLGLLYKIGKHHEHLSWYDPMAALYPLNQGGDDFVVCAAGDNDDDAVCDDWDRQLDTPAGARVDGAGVALDTDLDGIIDLYDKCVTLPGPADNDGCPLAKDAESAINMAIKDLDFSLDSDVIPPSYYSLLDQAAEYLNYFKDDKYDVVGHTDTRASASYNMDLSRRRAEAVKAYLVEKGGVSPDQLTVVAKGETDLRFPECKPASVCPEWKNHANRRVVFVKQ